MKYLVLLPYLGFFVFVIWAMQFIMPKDKYHRRIWWMVIVFIIALMASFIAYIFFKFGLDNRDQQEIINYLKQYI